MYVSIVRIHTMYTGITKGLKIFFAEKSVLGIRIRVFLPDPESSSPDPDQDLDPIQLC
jgi:hypothetical protein